MPRASCNGIEIEYETFGDPQDPPLLLVAGLGAQLLSWDDELCQGFVDRGFYVIRFDNRDVGLSTKIDAPEIDLMEAVATTLAGGTVEAPYHLTDMADDAWGLVDALGIDKVNLVGMSHGRHDRADHGHPAARAGACRSRRSCPPRAIPTSACRIPTRCPSLLEPGPSDREGAHRARRRRQPGHRQPRATSTRTSRGAGTTRAYDRCFYPQGDRPPAAGDRHLAGAAPSSCASSTSKRS